MVIKKAFLKVYYTWLNFKDKRKREKSKRLFPKLPLPKIINTTDTLNYIIQNRVSVSRFGDGELSLVKGNGIAFQKSNDRLREIFLKILVEENPNHLACLPYSLIDRSNLKDNASKYWQKYFEENYFSFIAYLNLDKVYYDALITRLYIDVANKDLSERQFQLLKQVWRDKDLLVIEGKQSRLGVGNDLFGDARSLRRIIAPAENAFDFYDDILNYVAGSIQKDILILIALGPTATALAWDLSKLGYWAMDIGHVDIEYEWMRMGATEKVPVKNKFVGDIFEFRKEEDEYLQEYERSIIKNIG